jgi:hypothetical protein
MLNQPLFAALDVSLETTTICIMSSDGTITKEAVVATEPDSIAICLGDDLTRIERIGLEAGPLSEWLVRELSVLGGLAGATDHTRSSGFGMPRGRIAFVGGS